jgi:hypothetical protein
MAGARTQLNGPVNGLTGTRVVQDTPVDVNQEVWQMWIFFFPPLSSVHFTVAGSPSL